MIATRSLALAAIAPLALALAACGSNDEAATAGVSSGEPIAAIEAPEGQSWLDITTVTPEDGYRLGNPDAPLRLIEYASHTCHVCASFSQEAKEPLEDYIADGRVSLEIRNQVHNALDLTIAMLVRCGAPENFHPLAGQAWSSFDEIMGTAQSSGAALEQAMQAPEGERFQRIAEAAGLLDFFAARGISRDQAMQCLAEPAAAERIVDNSNRQSDELNITGTPTFFLNDRRIEGTNWASVESALQQAGAR